METDTTTEATNDVFELNLGDMGSTIPVSHLALEDGIDVPVSGWQQVFDHLGIKVLVDPAERRAINTMAARKLFQHLRRQGEVAAERADLQVKRVAARHPVPVGAGLPMVEGASSRESLAAAGGVVSLEDEFGRGYGRPNFLREELAAGQRADDEKKRLAAERAKNGWPSR